MKRTNAEPIETSFGTFYGAVYRTDGQNGPTFYAETESGEVTVNGVTYSGTVYAERFSYNGELYLSCQHLTRWDDKRGHFYPASQSACKKLAAEILPVFKAWAEDKDKVRNARVQSLRSSHHYALLAANREIEKANAIARELRELDVPVADAPLFAGDESE